MGATVVTTLHRGPHRSSHTNINKTRNYIHIHTLLMTDFNCFDFDHLLIRYNMFPLVVKFSSNCEAQARVRQGMALKAKGLKASTLT